MNQRIEKVKLELEKTREKISRLQARQRDFERQLVELQNADILAIVRAIDVPPEELSELIRKLKKQALPNNIPQEEEIIED